MRKIFIVSGVVLFVALVSVGLNIYLYSQVEKHERAYNRPHIDSFLLGLLFFDSSKQSQPVDIKKEVIFRSLLLNFLKSDFSEPLEPVIEASVVYFLLKTCERKELDLMFDSVFNDVDRIDKHNAAFYSRDQMRLFILGGSRYVSQDYQGDECGEVLKTIKKDFFRYLHNYPTDS